MTGPDDDSPPEQASEAAPPSDHEPTGFFALDPISRGMLVAGVLALLLAYAPVVVEPQLTIFGYPWMFVVKPALGLILGGSFVAATYYVDAIQSAKEREAAASSGEETDG